MLRLKRLPFIAALFGTAFGIEAHSQVVWERSDQGWLRQEIVVTVPPMESAIMTQWAALQKKKDLPPHGIVRFYSESGRTLEPRGMFHVPYAFIVSTYQNLDFRSWGAVGELLFEGGVASYRLRDEEGRLRRGTIGGGPSLYEVPVAGAKVELVHLKYVFAEAPRATSADFDRLSLFAVYPKRFDLREATIVATEFARRFRSSQGSISLLSIPWSPFDSDFNQFSPFLERIETPPLEDEMSRLPGAYCRWRLEGPGVSCGVR